MLLRLLFLFFICLNLPCFATDSDTDPESLQKVTPEKVFKKCKDEYYCMLYRLCRKGIQCCTTRACEGCDACLNTILPWRYEDQKERTQCVTACLNHTSSSCCITGGFGTFFCSLALCWTSILCGCESKVALYAWHICESCCALAGCGACFIPDSSCPLAYCCENCFNLMKLDSGSGNSYLRNLVESAAKKD